MARLYRHFACVALVAAAGAAFLRYGIGDGESPGTRRQAAGEPRPGPGLAGHSAPEPTDAMPDTEGEPGDLGDASEVDPEAALLASLPKEDPVQVRFLVAGTTSALGRAYWTLVVDSDSAWHTEQGRTDEEGLTLVPSVAVALWARLPMNVSALEGCGWSTPVPRPDLSGPRPVPISVPVPSTARFEGMVIDDLGNPIPGAVVVIREFESDDTFRTGTGAEGRFEFSRPCDDGDADRTVALDAVAPGHLVSSLEVPARGASNLLLRLEPDTTSGSAVVRLVASDGSPAAGARVWMHRVGEPIPWERVGHAPESREARTRTLLAAAVHGLNPDDAGYEYGQQTVYVLDGVADAAGILRVPACEPGVYRLYGVLGSGDGAPRASGWSRGLLAGSLRVREVLDGVIEVAPPPEVTHATLTLRVARAVVGAVRTQRNSAGWTCGEASHAHDLSVRGWLWMGGSPLALDTTAPPNDGSRLREDGPFRFEGVPLGAVRLHVRTPHHGEVLVDVPAASDGETTTDVGTILVPDGRMVSGEVRRTGGGNLPEWSLRLEGYEGRFELQIVGHWIGIGDEMSDSFRGFLDRPPSPTTVAVFAFEGPKPYEVRLPFRPVEKEPGWLSADFEVPGLPAPAPAEEGDGK